MTVERLPRLPFGTTFDSVVQSVIFSLIGMVVGQCVAYRIARPPTGSDGTFDGLRAESADLITIATTIIYLLVYSVGYCCLYRVYRIKRRNGAMRAWCEGPELRNRWPVIEGYRLTFDDAFAKKYGKSFLGPGKAVAQPELHF